VGFFLLTAQPASLSFGIAGAGRLLGQLLSKALFPLALRAGFFVCLAFLAVGP
jgi:hypothetical protein